MECAECDISFLTTTTCLKVGNLQGRLLTVPTSAVHLELLHSKEVSVLGTENLNILKVEDDNIRTAPCLELQGLGCFANTFR